ncbi:hypothetical protein [Paenibacillus sp. TC-CSREp1]|uniref:hypothetical protein n=1 Tax=Paenibacillus sp. TC-CSREp1 TaxID=3410089 RepID=UPI003CFF085E
MNERMYTIHSNILINPGTLVQYRPSLMEVASASLPPSTASANDQEKPYFGIFGLWKILTIPRDAIVLKPA